MWRWLSLLGMVLSPAPAGGRTVEPVHLERVHPAGRRRRVRGTIHVQGVVDLYEDDAAMMAKLQAGGAALYDVVVPTTTAFPR